MSFQWIKRFLPRGLYGRAALILILPVITLQLVIAVSFVQRHFEGVTMQMTRSVLVELTYLDVQVAEAGDAAEARRIAAEIGPPLALQVAWPEAPRSSCGSWPRGCPACAASICPMTGR